MAVYKGRTADIKIKPSTTEHILQHCHDEFTYSVTSPRGRLLLINNQEFDTPVHPEQKHLNDRPGSEIDCDRLEELFKQLDFIVKVQENVSSKFMTELLEKETRLEEQEQYGMFALIILSHGDESCIYGKDGRPIYYKDIYKQLSARSFRAMAGKPKLLLFQACSGSSSEKSHLNEDSCEAAVVRAAALSGYLKTLPQPAQIPANSDLLIIRSSFPGYVSLLDSHTGSFLMKGFIEVMQQYSGQDELEFLSKKVRSTVYKLCEEDKTMFDKYGHQTIHNSSTLTKSLYFFPGYDPTKPLQNELERVSTDKPINIPIHLSETPSNTNTPTNTLSNPAIPVLPIPTRLQYRESQTTPSYTYCVYFTREGKLLYSGDHYGISGLSFTPKIPTDDERWNYSICEHNHHLYLLQHHHEHKQYYVHKINLSSQSVSENIIKFIGSESYLQQLVVNDEFIIISDLTAKCVRVYSTKNSTHLFNIKHEFISRWPCGVGLLGDSLVVGDCGKHQVSNMTINERPEVRWTCTEITRPSGLRVVENPQMILVASYSTKQIYILSYEGQKLSTLAVPECSYRIRDIAIYGKQIAVADKTKQIKVYEMTE